MKLATLAILAGTTAMFPLSATAQQPNPAPQNSQSQRKQELSAAQLRNQTLYSQSGKEIGRINTLVQDQENQIYAVVVAGNRQALVPANRLSYRNDRFTVTGNDNQLRFQTYDQQATSQYRELDPSYRIAIVGYDVDAVAAARPAGDGANVVVRQPAPVVRVDPADPRVIVRQQQPQVTVNQPQPEILVRQPQPTVTVNIPQPEIIVRMPQPDVNVATVPPQVRVLTARPDVAVTRPNEPRVQVAEVEPQVLVQREANSQPNVQVQRAGEPVVRYERAEPRVVINQPEGQPNVRIEQQGQPNVQMQQAQAQPGVAGGNPARPIAVSEIEGKDIYNLRGEDLGEVEQVVLGKGNQAYGVVVFGEFLGLGGESRLLPLSRMALQEDRIVIPGMTEAELRALPVYREGMAEYREAEPTYRASLASYIAAADQAHDRAGIAVNERAAVLQGTQPNVRAAEPADTGAVDATAKMRPFRVVELEDMDVYSLRGQKIGEVKRVVRRLGDNQGYVVLEHGGFLGLGEKEVPLPMNRVFMMGDRLVAAGLTEAEVNAIPDWDFNNREYREYGDNETVEIGLRG